MVEDGVDNQVEHQVEVAQPHGVDECHYFYWLHCLKSRRSSSSNTLIMIFTRIFRWICRHGPTNHLLEGLAELVVEDGVDDRVER